MARTADALSMLAEQSAAFAGGVAVHLNCGRGISAVASVAEGKATKVWCSDRYYPHVLAAREKLTRAGVGAEHVLHAHGAHTFPTGIVADVVAINLPRERLAVQQLLIDAFRLLRPGGRCVLAGATNEGIKPAVRMLEFLFGQSRIASQHSGMRLVETVKQADVPLSLAGFDSPYLDAEVFHQLDVSVRGASWTLFTRPGVFSWEHLDEATSLLMDAMRVERGESVLDIGCGAGLPGLIAARESQTGRVLLLDADADAVRGTAKAIVHAGLPNAEVRASDVTSAASDEHFDVVLSNPPFHAGKEVDLTLPRRFIRESWERLHAGGRLYLVANRTLPYERMIAERFGSVRTLYDGARFKVLGATR